MALREQARREPSADVAGRSGHENAHGPHLPQRASRSTPCVRQDARYRTHFAGRTECGVTVTGARRRGRAVFDGSVGRACPIFSPAYPEPPGDVGGYRDHPRGGGRYPGLAAGARGQHQPRAGPCGAVVYAPVSPSVWPRLPGPRASLWSGTASPRRARASSTPSTTRPARSRTAAATPSGPVVMFAHRQAVRAVDVQDAGGPEHHLVAPGRAAVGVRGRVRAARVASVSVSTSVTTPSGERAVSVAPSSARATSGEGARRSSTLPGSQTTGRRPGSAG